MDLLYVWESLAWQKCQWYLVQCRTVSDDWRHIDIMTCPVKTLYIQFDSKFRIIGTEFNKLQIKVHNTNVVSC